MKLMAHRGVMATHPENTMSAFRQAVTLGAHGIETDVHLSKDGVPVLIHDETLERTTNRSGAVRDFTCEQLRQANAGHRFDRQEPIPTLPELLQLLQGTDLRLNLELKTDVVRYERIEEIVLQTLFEHSFDPERIVFSSFNHETLHRLKTLAPEYETALLLSQPLFDLPRYMRHVGASALHPHVDVLTDEAIVELQSEGILIRPYTVKRIDQLERFKRLAVDSVFVNDIEWARTHI